MRHLFFSFLFIHIGSDVFSAVIVGCLDFSDTTKESERPGECKAPAASHTPSEAASTVMARLSEACSEAWTLAV